jgi:hypothetical protein
VLDGLFCGIGDAEIIMNDQNGGLGVRGAGNERTELFPSLCLRVRKLPGGGAFVALQSAGGKS